MFLLYISIGSVYEYDEYELITVMFSCLTLLTCCNPGAMASKVRRHDSRVHPYQRIVTTDRG
uniref:Protein quaking putative nuclear localisation signal domain-containing protein n=1 Tax=Anguilla anguilla TaxID=7936 RepID=A0A0E9QNP0_ANGAN